MVGDALRERGHDAVLIKAWGMAMAYSIKKLARAYRNGSSLSPWCSRWPCSPASRALHPERSHCARLVRGASSPLSAQPGTNAAAFGNRLWLSDVLPQLIGERSQIA